VVASDSGSIAACYWLKLSGADIAAYGTGTPADDTDAAPFSSSAWPDFGTDWSSYQWMGPGDENLLSPKFWKSIGGWNGGSNPEFPKLWWEP
jgi:hypothetical protein